MNFLFSLSLNCNWLAALCPPQVCSLARQCFYRLHAPGSGHTVTAGSLRRAVSWVPVCLPTVVCCLLMNSEGARAALRGGVEPAAGVGAPG